MPSHNLVIESKLLLLADYNVHGREAGDGSEFVRPRLRSLSGCGEDLITEALPSGCFNDSTSGQMDLMKTSADVRPPVATLLLRRGQRFTLRDAPS